MPAGKSRLTADPERANPLTAVHAWRTPSGADVDLTIVAHLEVYATIYDHAHGALPNETGGFLLGRVRWDPRSRVWLVEIDEAMPVEPLSQNPVHFSFGWRDVDRVRGHREQQGKALIGWYHTHPGMDIFLSETDMEKTHRVLFSEPFQVALVYDPVRRRAGYFFWEADRTIDVTSAPWREFDIAVADESESAVTSVQEPVEIVGSLQESPPAGAEVASPLVAKFQDAARTATRSIPAAPQDSSTSVKQDTTDPQKVPTPETAVAGRDAESTLPQEGSGRGAVQASSLLELSRPSRVSFLTGILFGVVGGAIVLVLAYFLLRQ